MWDFEVFGILIFKDWPALATLARYQYVVQIEGVELKVCGLTLIHENSKN